MAEYNTFVRNAQAHVGELHFAVLLVECHHQLIPLVSETWIIADTYVIYTVLFSQHNIGSARWSEGEPGSFKSLSIRR